MFFYDLVRLARRGRSILLRCFYGLIGLFAARLRALVYGIAVLTALAGLFWLAARSRLEMEPRD